MNHKHIGGNFDDFLREEGLLEDAEAIAIQRVYERGSAMAYDEKLAQRMRTILGELQPPDLVEKKMFGGIGFLVRGNMACGLLGDAVIVRLTPEQHAAALRQKYVRPFDMTGKPMKGWLMVAAAGCKTKAILKKWVQTGVTFALSLPAK